MDDFEQLKDNQELLPFSFGFIFEDKFLQGTFYAENGNTLQVCGRYGEDIIFNTLTEFEAKAQLGQEKLKIVVNKINEIFDKQRGRK